LVIKEFVPNRWRTNNRLSAVVPARKIWAVYFWPIKCYADSFAFSEDVLALTETWLTPEILDSEVGIKLISLFVGGGFLCIPFYFISTTNKYTFRRQMGVSCICCAVRPQSNALHNRGSLCVQASPLFLKPAKFYG